MRDDSSTMTRLTPVKRTALVYVLVAIPCAVLATYVLFFMHTVMRTEGERPIPIAEFAAGASVTHAFLMPADRLDAVDVRFVAAAPSSLRVLCALFRLNDRRTGAEDDPNRYTKLYQWTDTLTLPAGDHWQRITFPAIERSNLQWYRFEIRLLDDTRPGVSIMASQDNPMNGGKFWIDRLRQPGSLFLRAEGETLYETFQLRVEPALPPVLHHRAVQAAIAIVYFAAFVILVSSMLFGKVRDTAAGHADSLFSAAALSQVVILTLALALFFVVPDNFPDNPTNSFPLFPELVLFGTLCLIAGFSVRTSPQSADWWWPLRGDGKIWCTLLALCFGYIAFRAIQSGFNVYFGFDPCGSVAPSLIVRSECRLQASFSQNYAWKSFSQTTLMLAIGVLAAHMARTIPRFWRRALTALVLVGCAHALVGLGAMWFHAQQVLPAWIMVNSYGFERFTFFLPYPGYVWPQMAPAFVITAWQAVYGLRKRDRLISATAMAILAYGISATKQRGGLLLVYTIVLLSFGSMVFNSIREVNESKFGAALLFVCAAMWMALVYPLLMMQSHYGGLSILFYGRPQIWKVAFDGVMKFHPFFGFGYTRWAEFRTLAVGTPAEIVIDSAHGLWMRMLFEMGVVGVVLAALSLIGVVVVAVRNAMGLNGGVFLVICATIAFLICSSVEDVDYVRSVIVMHVFLAGICCGLPFRRSSASAERVSPSHGDATPLAHFA